MQLPVEKLANGVNVILEIEVQGAMNVKKALPEAVAVMITPPDYPTLEARLRGRGSNTEEDIANRLRRSSEELALLSEYDYVVVNENDGADRAAQRILDILDCERCRVTRNTAFADQFFGR